MHGAIIRLEERVRAAEARAAEAPQSPTAVARLADELLYLGAAYQDDFDFEKARAALDRSLQLREQLEAKGPPLDLTPFAMARRSRLTDGGAWRMRLRQWLEARQQTRDLTDDEKSLSNLAEDGARIN